MSRFLATLFVLAAVFAHANEPQLRLPAEDAILSSRHWLLLRQLEENVVSQNRWAQATAANELLLRAGDSSWVRFAAYSLGVDEATKRSPLSYELRQTYAQRAVTLLATSRKALPQPWSCAQLQAYIIVSNDLLQQEAPNSEPPNDAASALLAWLACGGGPHQPAQVADSYRDYLSLAEGPRRDYLMNKLDFFRTLELD
ncbi:MAG: hypothetical protein HN405_07835 [Planctomycetes bacterium]|jgi:hypothetical protein|nr:hypothetical protein [Planctomycetota bacterium]MBT4028055.1 hypothetical protein [Planctomycetota bacterium]MBT4560160.1 hypothetical protein [Planctomycetota bacterium]MBT5101435.1 hypothetical protein [Planctomycetota bacterium]MBT7012405.1 hypothetical protein [Planctomycetota bacterium]